MIVVVHKMWHAVLISYMEAANTQIHKYPSKKVPIFFMSVNGCPTKCRHTTKQPNLWHRFLIRTSLWSPNDGFKSIRKQYISTLNHTEEVMTNLTALLIRMGIAKVQMSSPEKKLACTTNKQNNKLKDNYFAQFINQLHADKINFYDWPER